MFCVALAQRFDPSTQKLNCLICHRGCTSTERLMKMQGMSNKRKTSFKRPDRKYLVNVTQAAGCNWFGWHVLGENGPQRTAATPPLNTHPTTQTHNPSLSWNGTLLSTTRLKGSSKFFTSKSWTVPDSNQQSPQGIERERRKKERKEIEKDWSKGVKIV